MPYIPTPERPMAEYQALVAGGTSVYRYNNVHGYWAELQPDGAWLELGSLEGEDWERGAIYHDDSCAYCDQDALGEE